MMEEQPEQVGRLVPTPLFLLGRPEPWSVRAAAAILRFWPSELVGPALERTTKVVDPEMSRAARRALDLLREKD